MRPAVRDAWRAFNEPLEGVVLGMYADVRGLVTTGMGNLIDPLPLALKLPWKFLGAPAPEVEVRRAFAAVKNDPDCARLGWRYALAHPGNNVRLTEEDIDVLIVDKLHRNDVVLGLRFADWEQWPADAQLAAHSMTWAMGDWFHGRFPKCSKALDSGDFAAAAAECRMMPEEGTLVLRNDRNVMLFKSAAVTTAPDTLCWSPGPA